MTALGAVEALEVIRQFKIGLLYDSPFTDINSQGLEGVFSPKQVDTLISVSEDIRATAAA